MNLNEIHVSCIEYTKVCEQKDLPNSADSLQTKRFSILSAKNRHFVYNRVIFFISVEFV
jgi:hypothetical protein